ncbi:MAG: hypothetical protein KF812_00455 [Fimbriimonadaceae bacterium]|nr:hypothetical protein [Fimbriimonadaceae bacterium]
MAVLSLDLKAFQRRIRLVRAWRTMAWGGTAGAGLGSVALGLDLWTNVIVPANLGAGLVLGGLFAGTLIGFILPVAARDVMRSVDRRAGLKDRLTTALDLADSADEMADAQRRDADRAAQSVHPKGVYPFRWSRTHTIWVIATVIAMSFQVMAMTGVGRLGSQLEQKADLASSAVQVRRIERELMNRSAQLPPTKIEEQLAAGMASLAEKLEKGKISREDALKEADKLAQKAEDAAKERASVAGTHLDNAENAAQQAQQRAFKEAGLREDQARKMDLSSEQRELLNRLVDAEEFENPVSTFDPATLRAAGMQNADQNLMGMNREQTEQVRQSLQNQMNELQARMNEGAMDSTQRQQLEQQVEDLKLSPEARQTLEQMQQPGQSAEQMADLAQRLQELAPNMSQEMQQALQQMAQQSMSPEQMQAMSEMLQQALENNTLNQEQMEQLQQQLEQQMTPEQMQQAQQQMQQMQQLMESLAANQDVRQALQQAMQSDQMQRVAEAMQGMREAQQNLQEGQGMSQQQQEQLQQQIEQAASGMNDPQLREQFRQQMQQAMEQMQAGTGNLQAAQQMMQALGQQAMRDAMQSAREGNDNQTGDLRGNITRDTMPWEPGGTTVRTGIRGERRESDANEDYVEVRAPAQNNGPSRVPYQQVLPQYRREAERSTTGNRLPKERRDRIREYYDSIQGKK